MGEPNRIAYLVNKYPAVSHSFIRREIQALERRGWKVHRFAMRGWDAHLPDPEDLKELAKTKYLLKGGALPLIKATILTMVTTPVRFSAALRLAFRHARPSDRPFPVHLIYLMEACWLSRRLKVLGLRHLHAHFGTNPAEVALLVQELSRIQFSFTVHGPRNLPGTINSPRREGSPRRVHYCHQLFRAQPAFTPCEPGLLGKNPCGSLWLRIAPSSRLRYGICDQPAIVRRSIESGKRAFALDRCGSAAGKRWA